MSAGLSSEDGILVLGRSLPYFLCQIETLCCFCDRIINFHFVLALCKNVVDFFLGGRHFHPLSPGGVLGQLLGNWRVLDP